jgi:hypothetical protein
VLPLCSLCLCDELLDDRRHHRDTENTEVAQRNPVSCGVVNKRAAGESRPLKITSEVQLQCELEDPRIKRIRDLTKRGCIDILRQSRAGDEEVSVVENVEYFRTKFDVHVSLMRVRFINPKSRFQ